jgi:hypothetical protein
MIRPATPADIVHVVTHMRSLDAEEHFACRFSEDRALLAADIAAAQALAIKSYAFCTVDGDPAAILTASLIAPGLAHLHRVATDRWPEIARQAFRFGVAVFVPCVLAPTVRRAECSILAKHREAALILRKLGFADEGLRRRRGKNGEDFRDFAWLNPNSLPNVDVARPPVGSPSSTPPEGEAV